MIDWELSRANAFNVILVVVATGSFVGYGLLLLWFCTGHLVILMCGLALYVGGFLLGFLFGIPRVDLNGKGAARVNTVTEEDDRQQPGTGLEQNTNLEQISDWLTKIIVGVGLVELKTIYGYFQGAVRLIAGGTGMSNIEEAQALAASVVVFYFILGFLSGYILTRMFLAHAFKYADQLSSKSDVQLLNKTAVPSFGKGTTSEAPDVAKTVKKAAAQYAKVPFKNLSGKPEEYAAWAKAQLINEDYENAIKGYALAVSQFPEDIELLLEFAKALHEAGRPMEDVHTKLLTAYRKITPRTPQSEVETLYNGLVYVSLYLDPPEGFNDAIKYGEEFLARPVTSGAASIWVSLASAYGQKYSYYSGRSAAERESAGVDLTEVKRQAFNAIQKALESDPKSLEIIKMLMLKDYTTSSGERKNEGENDLECFVDDPDFRKLLGLQ